MQTVEGNHIATSPEEFTYLMRDDTNSVIAGFERRAVEIGHIFTDDMRDALRSEYQVFVQGLIQAYQDASHGRATVIHLVDAEDVNRSRNEKIQAFLDVNGAENYVVVTMDPLCDFPGAIPLAVSRLFDPAGLTSVQMTNRPGSISISEQIEEIHRQAHGREVILVEDDLFTGSTIYRTMALLDGAPNRPGVSVRVAALFPGIQARLHGGIDLENIMHIDPVFTVDIPEGSSTEDVLDIGDPRDFLVGGDGLVTEAGRMPYVLPFVSPSARASVLDAHEHNFSETVIDLTHSFYMRAESITGIMWSPTFCEPAARDGLVHHEFVTADRLNLTSMAEIMRAILVRHSGKTPTVLELIREMNPATDVA